MATTRRPCGGPGFVGTFPVFWRGSAFAFALNQTAAPVDWSAYTLTLTLDGPLADDGTAPNSVELTIPGGGTVAPGGASAVFSEPAAWGLANLSDGDWELHAYETPPGGEPNHLGWGVLPVATAPGGPP
jgi:hypothetical protein